ncbi:MAG: TRAP transporter substrate-binding protein DctP [SAR324 cluster bacterium]|nr:TRAP transporter substrate-binding protein DctP [SAR324 cluster bacterium]MBL7034884.1 TRAP transporter substrate-binding protein DctP [SAR324 cluster bacterium]
MIKAIKVIIGASFIAMMMTSITTPVFAGEVTLNGAGCFPIGHPVSKPWESFVNTVNERGKGVIQIKLIGGAPAIGSPFTLVQKMSKGAYDIVGCTEGYFGNVLIEGAALRFSEYPYSELRKNGAIDYLQKLFAEKNIHYLARYHDFGPFHLWLNKAVSKPDLSGLHLRISPIYKALFTALGATVQRSNTAQVYTYMENGTVQGFGWPMLGWVPSWAKVTKYRVEPGFYNSALHNVINLKTWKSLDAQQQALLTKIGLEFEAKSESSTPEFQAQLNKQRDWLASKGMETITFEGTDREKWLSSAVKEGWAEVIERSPKHGLALKELFTK